jgi:hypothetical protein
VIVCRGNSRRKKRLCLRILKTHHK